MNELLLEEQALVKDPGTILLGPGAALDSMGFVNFVVGLDEEISAAGLNVSVVEELNRTGNWVASVSDLIRFLSELAQKKSSGSTTQA